MTTTKRKYVRKTPSEFVDALLARKTDIVRRKRASLPKYMDRVVLISEMNARGYTILMNETDIILIRKDYLMILN